MRTVEVGLSSKPEWMREGFLRDPIAPDAGPVVDRSYSALDVGPALLARRFAFVVSLACSVDGRAFLCSLTGGFPAIGPYLRNPVLLGLLRAAREGQRGLHHLIELPALEARSCGATDN